MSSPSIYKYLSSVILM